MKKNNLKSLVAIIDIGSNSVRLLITNGVFFNKKLITTRLAENKSENGELNKTSVYRTVEAISTFKAEAESAGATKIYAFATEAVRSAKNKCEFLELAYKTAGLNIEVLSGEVEAEIGLLGANLGKDGSIIDIGGASTEIAVKKCGKTQYKKSVQIGAVTLLQKNFENVDALKSYVDGVIENFNGAPVFNVKAIGGTATALATIDLKLKVYDSTLTDGHYLSRANLEKITSELFNLSPNEIIERYAVSKTRAEVISGGAYVLYSILKRLNLDGVTISEKDNLEGYYYKKLSDYENE